MSAPQSCLTLCDPVDCSPPRSPVLGKNTRVGSRALLQGDLPDPGIERRNLALQADSSEPPEEPLPCVKCL